MTSQICTQFSRCDPRVIKVNSCCEITFHDHYHDDSKGSHLLNKLNYATNQ